MLTTPTTLSTPSPAPHRADARKRTRIFCGPIKLIQGYRLPYACSQSRQVRHGAGLELGLDLVVVDTYYSGVVKWPMHNILNIMLSIQPTTRLCIALQYYLALHSDMPKLHSN